MARHAYRYPHVSAQLSNVLSILEECVLYQEDQELKLALDLAIEYRQRIADWLHPGEYERRRR